VAAHVRRGDRTIYGMNMTELCYNITKPKIDGKPNQCQDKVTHELKDCIPMDLSTDFGCDHELSFGALSIELIIDKVGPLVGSKADCILFLSDDPHFIDDEIARYRASHPIASQKWKLYSFVPPPSLYYVSDVNPHNRSAALEAIDRSYQHLRFGSGALSGAYFHASIKIVQSCIGFLGDLRSGVAQLMLFRMCAEHRGIQAICPPFFTYVPYSRRHRLRRRLKL
jgi:hypothetical protein